MRKVVVATQLPLNQLADIWRKGNLASLTPPTLRFDHRIVAFGGAISLDRKVTAQFSGICVVRQARYLPT